MFLEFFDDRIRLNPMLVDLLEDGSARQQLFYTGVQLLSPVFPGLMDTGGSMSARGQPLLKAETRRGDCRFRFSNEEPLNRSCPAP